MNEPKVKELTQAWLEAEGYVVRPEPPAPAESEDREMALDFYAYRDADPQIYWVEAKGDVNLSELLQGFIRTEFCVHYGGGLGLLAIPSSSVNRLRAFSDFLGRSCEKVALFDVEKGKIITFYEDEKI